MSRNHPQQQALSPHGGAISVSQQQQLRQQRKRQRQRRTVLTEEEYSDTLSTIIQRDYYPDLTELERQTADLADSRQWQQHEETMVNKERREVGRRTCRFVTPTQTQVNDGEWSLPSNHTSPPGTVTEITLRILNRNLIAGKPLFALHYFLTSLLIVLSSSRAYVLFSHSE
jgi:hypothetical protein